MKKQRYWIFLALFLLGLFSLGEVSLLAQCSMCNAVASAQSEGAAKALNHGILFLLVPPVAIMSVILLWAFRYRNSSTHS